MLDGIVRIFIKDSDNVKSAVVREAHGRLAGIIGILCNLLLFFTKLIAGLVFSSISVTADAVNNLSDALSSVIATVSFKLSNKPADEEHPYGHRRIEYVAGMLVSIIILFIGYELLRTSVDKIIHPSDTGFGAVVVAVLCFSLLVKFFMNRMYLFIADKINSTVLKATAQDSINDVYSTAAVLVSAVVSKISGVNLDGYMGVLVSLFIMYSGVSLIKETLNPLLGTMPDHELVKLIEQKILSYDGILGIHDLMVHNYGPDRIYASVHAEVDAKEDVLVSHDIIDNIERDFLQEQGIHLVIHLDPIVTDDENVTALREKVCAIISAVEPRLSFHDFRVVFGQTHTNLIFDLVVPYSMKVSDKQLGERISSDVRREIGGSYCCVISFDREYCK